MLQRMMMKAPSFLALEKWSKLLVTSVSLLLLSACSSTDVRLNLSASADLNTNNYNEPLPVIVRVYQLSDATNASYSSSHP